MAAIHRSALVNLPVVYVMVLVGSLCLLMDEMIAKNTREYRVERAPIHVLVELNKPSDSRGDTRPLHNSRNYTAY